MFDLDKALNTPLSDLSELSHADDYDPVKRREYYLKNRQLKGRQPSANDNNEITKRPSNESPAQEKKPASNEDEERKARAEKLRNEASARVKELQQKLKRLKQVLKELVDQAKKLSGDDETNEEEEALKKAEKAAEDAKPLTAKEKREAADRAKKAYQEQKKKGPVTQDQKTQQLQSQIKSAEKRIAAARGKLEAIVEDARRKTAAKTSEDKKGQ